MFAHSSGGHFVASVVSKVNTAGGNGVEEDTASTADGDLAGATGAPSSFFRVVVYTAEFVFIVSHLDANEPVFTPAETPRVADFPVTLTLEQVY